jgi:hypothetical protein
MMARKMLARPIMAGAETTASTWRASISAGTPRACHGSAEFRNPVATLLIDGEGRITLANAKADGL